MMTRLPSTSSVTTARSELLAEHQRVMAELAAETETAESPAELLAAQVRDRLEQECRSALVQLDREFEQCLERDRLQALRPVGCCCLGVGGTGHLLPFFPVPLWSQWCWCPEAEVMQAAVREHNAKVEAMRAGEEAAAVATEQALRMARANLPQRLAGLTFGHFEGDPAKRLALDAVRSLTPDRPGRGIYLHGGVGTGKTTLAALAVRKWIDEGGTALFLPVSELLDMLRPGGREMAEDVAESQAGLMQRMLSTGLLVLDDMGTERVTGWSRERLFLVINRRYDAGRLTVMTSNYSLGQMAKRLAGQDEPVEGNRIAWRIQETCELIELGGKNYRERSGDRPAPSSRNGPRHLAAVGVRLPYADDSIEDLPL